MNHRIGRRPFLRALGVAVVFTIAGCNALQDNSDSTESTEKNPTPTQTVIGSTATESDVETGSSPNGKNAELTLTKEADGNFQWAGAFNDTLTYITHGNQKRVVYGGNKEPAFEVVRNYNMLGVDGGIAYTAKGEEDGTTFQYLMSAGEELARVDSTNDENIHLSDTLDGEPLWSRRKAGEFDGIIHHSNDRIETGYDSAGLPFNVDGKIGFVGKQDSYDRGKRDVVVDGSVVQEQVFIKGLTRSIDGRPTFIRLTQEGEVLQHGDQKLGNQYTRPSSGEIYWFGELGGSLAFIAYVAEDKIEGENRTIEQVLWYDGEEVARHERISNKDGTEIAMTDEGLAYAFGDPGISGVAIEGEIITESGAHPVESIGGDLAYATGGTLVYDGQEVAEYEEIQTIFELDGDLTFLGYTEPAESYGEIVRAN